MIRTNILRSFAHEISWNAMESFKMQCLQCMWTGGGVEIFPCLLFQQIAAAWIFAEINQIRRNLDLMWNPGRAGGDADHVGQQVGQVGPRQPVAGSFAALARAPDFGKISEARTGENLTAMLHKIRPCQGNMFSKCSFNAFCWGWFGQEVP